MVPVVPCFLPFLPCGSRIIAQSQILVTNSDAPRSIQVSSLLSRVDGLGENVRFTEDIPDHNTTSPAAIALHSEARTLLAELAKTEKEELVSYDRFTEVGADDERVAEEAGESNHGFRAMASKRIEHGSQSHMKAFQVSFVRLS